MSKEEITYKRAEDKVREVSFEETCALFTKIVDESIPKDLAAQDKVLLAIILRENIINGAIHACDEFKDSLEQSPE